MAEIIETRPTAKKESDQTVDSKKGSKARQGKGTQKERKGDTKSKMGQETKAEDLDYYVHYSECEFHK